MADTLVPPGHRGTRAVQRMVEFAPATGGLALWVRHHDLHDNGGENRERLVGGVARQTPLVATDGLTVFYDAAFEGLPLAVQTGLVAHEVLHIALRHPQRWVALQRLTGDVDLKLFNVCADAIVNSTIAHLSWLKLPPEAVQLDRLLANALGVQQSTEAALLEWDVERLYRAIDDRRPPKPGRTSTGQDQNSPPAAQGSPSDAQESTSGAGGREDGPRAKAARVLGATEAADLMPGTLALGAPQDEADQARDWSERLTRAHAGDGAHSMLRTLLADLPRSRTPWEQVLRTQLARSLAQRPGPSWSRPARSYIANQGRAGPHRRMPWEPGTSATRSAPQLAVVVDVSGSITDALMERFAREIEAIARRQGAELTLIIGDDQVQHVERLVPGRNALADIKFKGGGGTDFTPLLEEAQRHRPDITVVLTDLDGPARFRPRSPVIWAVPEAHPPPVAPFGRLLLMR